MTYKTSPGAHPSIQINVLDELPTERYLLALKRVRALIAASTPLHAFDDDSVGNKSMGCSWGLCMEAKSHWPHAQDHTFPVDFEKRGRFSPLDLRSRDKCPMDTRDEPGLSGCFYTCRVFQADRRQGRPAPTRDEALALYDAQIAATEAR